MRRREWKHLLQLGTWSTLHVPEVTCHLKQQTALLSRNAATYINFDSMGGAAQNRVALRALGTVGYGSIWWKPTGVRQENALRVHQRRNACRNRAIQNCEYAARLGAAMFALMSGQSRGRPESAFGSTVPPTLLSPTPAHRTRCTPVLTTHLAHVRLKRVQLVRRGLELESGLDHNALHRTECTLRHASGARTVAPTTTDANVTCRGAVARRACICRRCPVAKELRAIFELCLVYGVEDNVVSVATRRTR